MQRAAGKERTAAACVLWATMLATPVPAQSTGSIYERAAAYLQRGQASSAIALLEPRLKDTPGDLKALTLMGMALSVENRREQANRYFRQALDANPKFAPALKNLAINEMALGEGANAKRHFEQLLQLTPSDSIAHFTLGEIEFAAKDYGAAVSHYEQSGRLYLHDASSLLKFAEACVTVKQMAKAADALEHMPEQADAANHFAAGVLLASIERYAAAAREFDRARSGNPYDAGFNLMLAQIKAKQYAAAVRAGEDLVARGYRQAELYNLLAQAYENDGKTREAYEALRTATNVDPGDATNYIDLIALCLTHKNHDLALEISDIGVARLPKSDRLHLQRGIVLAMKEQFEGARAEFETAVKLAPQRSLPYVALGLMLLQMDQAGDAVNILRERAKAGEDYLVLWFLGEALNRSGAAAGSPEEDEAIDALSRSILLDVNVTQSRILLAKLLARRGVLDLAAKHLTRALELDPDNVAATYQLAQVYQKKGDLVRAKQLFAKVSKAKAEDREQFTRADCSTLCEKARGEAARSNSCAHSVSCGKFRRPGPAAGSTPRRRGATR